MSIQDDIDKLGASGSAVGQCPKCGDENPYSSIVCSGCHSRLPWADAVMDKARATASTHAPLSIASARATVNPGSSGGGAGSGGSRGPVAPAVATVLLIAGALIGAAVVVPNFTSRSETAHPTPAAQVPAPRLAQPAPPSAPAYQAPPVQAPQVAPPAQVPAPVQRPQRAAPRAVDVDATDNIPQMVASISQDIRNARSQEEADAHAFACRGMIEKLNEKIGSDPGNAELYAEWSTTMSHLESAASYKSAFFNDPDGAIGQTKLLSMGAQLQAAQGAAISTQQLIEQRKNPALAQQRQGGFRERANSYESQQRPTD